jgi:PAS domain S-box-containing protein
MRGRGTGSRATPGDERPLSLLRHLPVGVYRTSVEGGFVDANPALAELLGYPSIEELLAQRVPDLYVDPTDRERLLALVARDGMVRAFPTRLRRRDGREVAVEIAARAVRDEAGALRFLEGAVVDVSDRVEAERRLAERERLLSAIVDAEPECVKLVGPGGVLLEMNRAGLAMIEAGSPEEVLGRPIYPLVAPEHREAFRRLIEDVLAGGSGSLEFRIVGLRGTPRWLETTVVPLREADGGIRAALAITRDVTERRQAEEALRSAERRYRTLIEQIPAVTYVDLADPSGTTLFVSPQIEQVFGVTQEEWVSADVSLWVDMILPEDRDRTLGAYHRALERREPFHAEYRILARDGRVRWIRDRGEFIPGGDGGPDLLQGVMFDVTADREREEELRRSREEVRELLARLVRAQEEERARIAADIHDDSIQVMTAVGMRIEAARRRASSPEEAASLAKLEDTVAAAIRRLRRLLFELRPRTLDEGGARRRPPGAVPAAGRGVGDRVAPGGWAGGGARPRAPHRAVPDRPGGPGERPEARPGPPRLGRARRAGGRGPPPRAGRRGRVPGRGRPGAGRRPPRAPLDAGAGRDGGRVAPDRLRAGGRDHGRGVGPAAAEGRRAEVRRRAPLRSPPCA